jgi:MYXO-CTERM domain-containing protein
MNARRLLAALAVAPLVLSTASCDMELPAGDITSPQTWGDFFLDKYADELVIDELEEGPAPLAEPRVVLLITGVTIPAEWFDPIKARLERDGFIPVVYEPPDLLSGDLFENSEKLADVVDDVRADTGYDKIDILAECTGGLIARHYIQSLGGDQYVSRMVTFISPQHGVDKAPLAASVAGWPALYDLSPGSEFLEAVNGAPLPSNVPFTSIYTCTDEYIQPYETSIIPGATNIGLCEEFVGHFQFFYDPEIYLIMHDALTEPLPGEAPDPESPDPSDPAESSGGSEVDPDGPEGNENANEASGVDDVGHAGCTMGGTSSDGAGVMLLLGAAAVFVRRRRAAFVLR